MASSSSSASLENFGTLGSAIAETGFVIVREYFDSAFARAVRTQLVAGEKARKDKQDIFGNRTQYYLSENTTGKYKDKTQWILPFKSDRTTGIPRRNDRQEYLYNLVAENEKERASIEFIESKMNELVQHIHPDLRVFKPVVLGPPSDSTGGIERQQAHRDYPKEICRRTGTDDTRPMSCGAIVVLQDNTSLLTWPKSHRHECGRTPVQGRPYNG